MARMSHTASIENGLGGEMGRLSQLAPWAILKKLVTAELSIQNVWEARKKVKWRKWPIQNVWGRAKNREKL